VKTLIYLHGFNSSPNSFKVKELQAAITAENLPYQLIVPAVHEPPLMVAKRLQDLVAEQNGQEIVFLGSSLGAFFSTGMSLLFVKK